MSFRSVEMLPFLDDPKFFFWEEFYFDYPKTTGKDLDLFRSKRIWLNVPLRKVLSKNYSTKKTYMKNSHFGCSSVTCGKRSSNMCGTISSLHHQDKCYCYIQHLVYFNWQMVLQVTFSPWFTLHQKICMLWRRVNLDVLLQHVEHDVTTCALQHLALVQ